MPPTAAHEMESPVNDDLPVAPVKSTSIHAELPHQEIRDLLAAQLDPALVHLTPAQLEQKIKALYAELVQAQEHLALAQTIVAQGWTIHAVADQPEPPTPFLGTDAEYQTWLDHGAVAAPVKAVDGA